MRFSSYVAGYYESKTSEKLAEYFNDFDRNKSVFVDNALETVIFIPTNKYYQHFLNVMVGEVGEEWVYILKDGLADEVITTPQYIEQRKDLFVYYKEKSRIFNHFVILEKIY